MKKIVMILLILLGLTATIFADTNGHDFGDAENIIANKTSCNDLTEKELEQIGDYYMEQMHPGEAHNLMDEMMGGEGSESLRLAHINMAYRFYCSQIEEDYSYNSRGMMRGMMYSDNLNTNYGGSSMMNSYWNPFGFGAFGMGFMMLIFWGLIIWLIYFLITTVNKNNKEPKKENPIEIAKRRFAKGEITKKEFEEIKKELKK